MTEAQERIVKSFNESVDAIHGPPELSRLPLRNKDDAAFWCQCFVMFCEEFNKNRPGVHGPLLLEESLPWESESDYAKIVRIAARMADCAVIEKLRRR